MAIKWGNLYTKKINHLCMQQLMNALNIKDKLHIELVKSGLKPASYIDFGGVYFPSAYDVDFEGVYIRDLKGNVDSASLLPHIIKQFEAELKSVSVVFHPISDAEMITYFIGAKPSKPISLKTKVYAIAFSPENIDKIIEARTDCEIGLALGYPREDVKAYHQVIDRQRRDGTYFCRSLGNAIQAGVEVPQWLAYISDIPKELDLVKSQISPQIKELGNKYQNYIRKTNEPLAESVEQEFLRRCSKTVPDGFIHYAYK